MKPVVRIAAILFIFFCTAIAWLILGVTIVARTESADGRLRGQVNANWGTPQVQTPPEATYEQPVEVDEEVVENGRKITRTVTRMQTMHLPLEASRIGVSLDLAHRQKGLLWYSTYTVDFAADYTYRNTSSRSEDISFSFRFPATRAIFDGLTFQVNGRPVEMDNRGETAVVTATIPGGEHTALRVSYRSQGLGSWRYSFGDNIAQVRDFEMKMTTNFKDINFPEDTLSATEKTETADGWQLAWTYENLVSGYQLGMEMPEKLQPGPLAGRISFFAPVSLLFFFFILFILTTLRDIDLHPMNYFFLAAAFFAFHLLLAYLVDHISIHLAFLISSLVSLFLVGSYLRLVVNWRFALREALLAQVLYLVLFSYAFFLEGFTGLSITIASILSLFVTMQLTGRVRWSEKFQGFSNRQVANRTNRA